MFEDWELGEMFTDYLPQKLVVYLVILVLLWFSGSWFGYKPSSMTGYTVSRIILSVVLLPITFYIIHRQAEQG